MKLTTHLISVASLLIFACASYAANTPNVLFIAVDDQSPFDSKFYNPKSELRSPNLDQLAAQGMVFDGVYHMGAFVGVVCTPSRHMIMTGRTVWHLPIGPTAKEHCPPGIEQNSLPAVFNRGGYTTMRTCKVDNTYEAANKLFTVRHDASKRGGDDQSGSAWHAQQVLAFLNEREAAKDTKPFLIYFGFSHPHDTCDGKPELLANYGATNQADPNSIPAAHPKQPKLPVNWLPAKPFPDGHSGLRDETAVSGVWRSFVASTKPKCKRPDRWSSFIIWPSIPSPLGWARQTGGPLALRLEIFLSHQRCRNHSLKSGYSSCSQQRNDVRSCKENRFAIRYSVLCDSRFENRSRSKLR